MANSVAPDSWEQQADNGDIAPPQDKSIESKFSTLNVNAAEFVPSFCINSSPQNSNTADSSCNVAVMMNTVTTSMPPEIHHGNTTSVVLPDPVGSRVEEPPAGGGAPPPNVTDQINNSPEHQPADSWEEAAVDGDPLLTPS